MKTPKTNRVQVRLNKSTLRMLRRLVREDGTDPDAWLTSAVMREYHRQFAPGAAA